MPHADAFGVGELQAAYAFLDSHDYREGVQSFLAKRKPDFTGN